MATHATMATVRAVLIVGHGTILDLEDVPEFLRRIRRGRPPSPGLIAEIQRRYRAIGRSPLLEKTESLGRALEARLGISVRVAMRFWEPLVDAVLQQLVRDGVQEVCILPVAPFSVHVYVGVVRDALAALATRGAAPPKIVPVEPYGSDPALVRAQASMIAPLLSDATPSDTELVLTAHSLPMHVLDAGDPYQQQLEQSATAIARELGWPASIAYQSQGEGGGEWLGPTLDATLTRMRDLGKHRVVVAPVGFLADHVETLYDLDIEAQARARDLGLAMRRAPTLGDHASLVDALAAVVGRALAQHGATAPPGGSP